MGTALPHLTLEEKVSLLAGVDAWHLPAIERLGIPPLKMTDGPSGARGAVYAGGPSSACAPCGTALAATFDVDLVKRVGVELGEEARAKGAHLLLAPTVNIHRTPLAGRNFECFSEDPFLASRMAAAYVEGVQSRGVGTTVKHFVGNDSEHERFTVSSEIDERVLREIYLPPFEAAIAAGSWALMTAYNRLGGTYCSEHPLLSGLLRDEWGWDGLVVSDWGGTHSTVEAAAAGLDVEMPGPPRYRGDRLVAAVHAGEIDEKVIDESLRRVLLAAERTGVLRGEGGDAERADDPPVRRAVLREAAAASIVVLRNDAVDGAPVLPLDRAAVRSIAVVGPNAAVAVVQGGGSCQVWPHYTVSPLEGIEAAAGDGATVVHEEGCVAARTHTPRVDVRSLRARDGSPGYDVVYHDRGTGDAVATVMHPRPNFRWAAPFHPDVDPTSWTATISTTFTPRHSGEHVLELRGTGRFRLQVDGAVTAETDDEAPGTAAPRRTSGVVTLEAAADAEVVIEYEPPAGGVRAMLELRCRPPERPSMIDDAADAAARADVAVVVVGTDSDWETEGRDRESMDLPGAQDELVRRVVAANPRTAVVVNSGAPVTMPWAADVPAVVQLWFAGQELGNALADVLFGVVEPSGRLPTTFPVELRERPAVEYPGEDGRVVYGESVFVGYRYYDHHAEAPRFPFGHGLSYTTFEYGPIAVDTPTFRDGDEVVVSVPVRNTGSRRGVEVVQVYVADIEASVPRPPKELKAFAKLTIAPGATETARLVLGPRAFSFWDGEVRAWRAEPGDFDVLVGSSSADIRGRARVTLSG